MIKLLFKRFVVCLMALIMVTPALAAAEKPVPGKITVMVFDRGEVPVTEGDAANNRWTRWIQANSPVEVEFIPVARANADQILIRLFGSSEAPDYIPYGSNPQLFVANRMALEITDEMLDQVPNYRRRISDYPVADRAAIFSGVRYGFGRFENVFHNHNLVIRKDWLDHLGLSVPTTAEELMDVIHAFTYSDPDGNGMDDTWGTSLTGDTQRIYAHMFGFPWPEKYILNDEGQVVYAWDRMESWLAFLKALVSDGCINPDFMLMKGDDDQSDFIKGRIGIYGQARLSDSSKGQTLYREFARANPGAELITIPLPQTEYGRYTAYLNGGVSYMGFIYPNTQNLEGVLAYINWYLEPAVQEYLSYGEMGVYYDKNADGTYYPVASAETIEKELAWSPFYGHSIMPPTTNPAQRHVNDLYNQLLVSQDEITQQFGALFYDMACIANDESAVDPRKWQQFLPLLPADLQSIKANTNAHVDNIIKLAICDPDCTAAEAVAMARDEWIAAGGEAVDAYYAAFYADADGIALHQEDFTDMKDMPVLTDAARAVYEQLRQNP